MRFKSIQVFANAEDELDKLLQEEVDEFLKSAGNIRIVSFQQSLAYGGNNMCTVLSIFYEKSE